MKFLYPLLYAFALYLTALRVGFDAHYYYLMGWALSGVWAAVDQEATEALAYGCHDPNIYFLRGLARSQMGRGFAGREDYRAMLRVWPYVWYAQERLGRDLLDVSPHEALPHLQIARDIFPLPETCVNLGVCYGKLGRLPEARAEFEAALKMDPKCELAKKNLEMAIEMR